MRAAPKQWSSCSPSEVHLKCLFQKLSCGERRCLGRWHGTDVGNWLFMQLPDITDGQQCCWGPERLNHQGCEPCHTFPLVIFIHCHFAHLQLRQGRIKYSAPRAQHWFYVSLGLDWSNSLGMWACSSKCEIFYISESITLKCYLT